MPIEVWLKNFRLNQTKFCYLDIRVYIYLLAYLG